jgi:hypothetical protein
LSESPYQPPTDQMAPADKSLTRGDLVGGDLPALLPFAQLGLRLLGVMFVVDGVGAMFGGAIQGLFQAQAYSDAGYSVPIDPHSIGWAAGGLPVLIAGIYLIVGGNWVLLHVFASPHRPHESSPVAVSDTRQSETRDDVSHRIS